MAPHSNLAIDTMLEVVNVKGQKRKAKVVFCSFSIREVDIAVLEILSEESDFTNFIEIAKKPVYLGQKMMIVGLEKDRHDENCLFVSECMVNSLIGMSIIKSDYINYDGLSGAALITIFEGNTYHLVGVHSCSDDNTSALKIGTKKIITTKELQENVESISDDLHGNRSHTLICEVIRVEGLSSFLNLNNN